VPVDRGRDKPPKRPGEPGNPGVPAQSGSRKAADTPKAAQPTAPGTVTVDQRGRNVWQFHGEAIDSTSMMLQRLDNPSLALEPTRKTKRLDSTTPVPPGKSPAGKPPAAKLPPGRAQPGASRGEAGSTARGAAGAPRRQQDDETHLSFEQSFSVKPGKGTGGGFDPYNNS